VAGTPHAGAGSSLLRQGAETVATHPILERVPLFLLSLQEIINWRIVQRRRNPRPPPGGERKNSVIVAITCLVQGRSSLARIALADYELGLHKIAQLA